MSIDSVNFRRFFLSLLLQLFSASAFQFGCHCCCFHSATLLFCFMRCTKLICSSTCNFFSFFFRRVYEFARKQRYFSLFHLYILLRCYITHHQPYASQPQIVFFALPSYRTHTTISPRKDGTNESIHNHFRWQYRIRLLPEP